MDIVHNILKGIVDIIYPIKILCLFCGKELGDINHKQLCRGCLSMLPFLSENVCIKCGRPIVNNDTDGVCFECKNTCRYFDGGASVFEFSGLIQGALYRLKFDGEMEIAQAVGKFMGDKYKKMEWEVDAVIPVPLHHDRLHERGFNQSYLLSREIGRECSIDVADKALIRQRYTESQVPLSRFQRMSNVKGAFSVLDSSLIGGKKILLVDDIMTTGSTLNECSSVLRKYGASSVYCLTAACPNHSHSATI